MNHYSQHTKGYKQVKLGTCNTNLWSQGCLVCSLAMMTNKYNPEQVNDLLRDNGGYHAGCLVVSNKAALILGLNYHGVTQMKPENICIACTGHYVPQGVPQHFFVFAPKGTINHEKDMILDPLDNPCDWKENKYSVSSYRLFDENVIDPEFPGAWDKMISRKVYTEFTKHNTQVTTDELAVFLSRLKS